METRITKKVDQYLTQFKKDIKDWFIENNSNISGEADKNLFLQYIYDYDNLILKREDFVRRKRIKNSVPLQIRCCACRANGEQCTRRKKNNEEYCGTHSKGTPYGIMEFNKC